VTTPPLAEQIELQRDRMWRGDRDLRIERAADAERFTETLIDPAAKLRNLTRRLHRERRRIAPCNDCLMTNTWPMPVAPAHRAIDETYGVR
jgi:hypothetical protein